MLYRLVYNTVYGIYRFIAYGFLLILLAIVIFLLAALVSCFWFMGVVIPRDILDPFEEAFRGTCK